MSKKEVDEVDDVEEVEDDQEGDEEDVEDDGEQEEDDPDVYDDDAAWLDTEDLKPAPKKKDEELDQAENFFTGSGSKQATSRLLTDLKAFKKSDSSKYGVSAEPIGDNLYLWDVKFFGFESKSDLGKDLAQYQKLRGIDHVLLEMRFPSEYPWKPPFIYVKRPRFQFHTGHVTIGGSICMELLTTSGWTPANDIENILIQIRSEMIVGNARLDLRNLSDYSEEEAKQNFTRVARQHGWEK